MYIRKPPTVNLTVELTLRGILSYLPSLFVTFYLRVPLDSAVSLSLSLAVTFSRISILRLHKMLLAVWLVHTFFVL